uniref:Putative endonuclease n=1 Tax=viral metagenome TaxID=1070528 RepID=A0A6M3K5S2_9ZZZZ
MLIYKATNKINGKLYIGQTTGNLSQRKRNHKCESLRGSNSVFHRAIRKYEFENFKWKVLCKCESKEELDEMEFHFIKQYNTHISNKKGYNMTFGGEYNNSQENWDNPKVRNKMINGIRNSWQKEGYKEKMSKIFKESWTEERRKKHSENVKRRYENPDYKKKMSERLKELWKNEEYRKKMVEFSKNKWKNEEYRKKMSEKVKDNAHIQAFKVSKDYVLIKNDKETIIHNLKKWCKEHNINYSTFCHYVDQPKYYKGYMVKHI